MHSLTAALEFAGLFLAIVVLVDLLIERTTR